MENAIELTGLAKRYDEFTLAPLMLSLPAGCIMGLIGENGAGKSTTIRLMLDLIARDGGEARLFGRDVRERPQDWKEQVGVVLDECFFPDTLNLKEIGRVLASAYRAFDAAAFDGYARRFDLSPRKKISDYSRGMKMKLSIAAALSHGARLLVLDEATSGLDPLVRDEMLDVFLEFIQDERNAVFISSHILSDLEKICDYIAFLHKGKLRFCEQKDALLSRYGVLKCTAADFARVNPALVHGARRGAFGVEALVERDKMPGGLLVERAGIEDIMLYMSREDER